MATFVINEWLWEDSSGRNGGRAQREALEVVAGLAESDHQIVVIEGSRFDRKAWRLCKEPDSMVTRSIVRLYVAGLRQSHRCLVIKPDLVAALPDELASSIKDDDHYLVQALLTERGAILVTTDRDLCEAVARAGLSCVSRTDFLATYF